MPSIAEILADGGDETQMHAALAAGLDVLGQNQTVTFIPYVRIVLPIDGFVFWLNASLLNPAQLSRYGLESADPVMVDGSLHYATVGTQVEDENIAIRRVDFAAETQIDAFAEIAPHIMYVGTWTIGLGSFKFTFNSRSTFYDVAKIYHYVGDAVYPVFEAQLIETAGQFDQRQIVSNSLPLWLSLLETIPYPSLVNIWIPLYPAYLIPDNLVPPYGAVYIPPQSTRALQAAPRRDRASSRSQLVYERAKLTFYGLRNNDILDFIDYTIDYTVNTNNFGITNSPVPQDEHRIQVELGALAMKKVVEFELNYYQSRIRSIAQQYITNCIPTFVPSDHPIPKPSPEFSIVTT